MEKDAVARDAFRFSAPVMAAERIPSAFPSARVASETFVIAQLPPGHGIPVGGGLFLLLPDIPSGFKMRFGIGSGLRRIAQGCRAGLLVLRDLIFASGSSLRGGIPDQNAGTGYRLILAHSGHAFQFFTGAGLPS